MVKCFGDTMVGEVAKLRAILGAAVTVVGLVLVVYALAAGAFEGRIGSEEGFTGHAAAAILGWFMILVGPAVWFGEAPVAITRAAEEAKKRAEEAKR